MPTSKSRPENGYRHEAFFYADDAEFADGCGAFVQEGLEAGEPALVVLPARKLDLVRERLGTAEGVEYADMAKVGANPARIIPAWRAFVDEHAASGVRVRGVGEPIYPERGPDELVECRRHESLLNLAFDDGEAWRLLCPYDVRGLSAAVLADARHNHRHVNRELCGDYLDPSTVLAWDDPLPAPPADPAEIVFTREDLALVRTFVSEHAAAAGFAEERVSDLVLAVNELATNSMRHGGGRGLLSVWRENGTFLCEVHDRGRITDPLAGRELPLDLRGGGRGLWLVNHLCDLVQVRSSEAGNVIRLHMSIDAAS